MTSPYIRCEAARWIVELDTAEKIEDLWPQFELWLNEKPEHRAAFLRVERGWRALEDLAAHYRRTHRTKHWSQRLGSQLLDCFGQVWEIVSEGSAEISDIVRKILRRLFG